MFGMSKNAIKNKLQKTMVTALGYKTMWSVLTSRARSFNKCFTVDAHALQYTHLFSHLCILKMLPVILRILILSRSKSKKYRQEPHTYSAKNEKR